MDIESRIKDELRKQDDLLAKKRFLAELETFVRSAERLNAARHAVGEKAPSCLPSFDWLVVEFQQWEKQAQIMLDNHPHDRLFNAS